jgi:hypothetical protein
MEADVRSAGVELMAMIFASVAAGIAAFVSFRLWHWIHTLRRPSGSRLLTGLGDPASRGQETRLDVGRKP